MLSSIEFTFRAMLIIAMISTSSVVEKLRVDTRRNGVNRAVGCIFDQFGCKDLEASRTFYEKFGFTVFGGNASMSWLILKNGDHVIGLFTGMFEKNILTFNPGWDSNANKLATFTDVRQLQRELKAQGVTLQTQADESTTGPASFVALDPDGNPILVDQHGVSATVGFAASAL